MGQQEELFGQHGRGFLFIYFISLTVRGGLASLTTFEMEDNALQKLRLSRWNTYQRGRLAGLLPVRRGPGIGHQEYKAWKIVVLEFP